MLSQSGSYWWSEDNPGWRAASAHMGARRPGSIRGCGTRARNKAATAHLTGAGRSSRRRRTPGTRRGSPARSAIS
ncbi:hypothetical protein ABT362_47915 [Nonomuraea rubra]